MSELRFNVPSTARLYPDWTFIGLRSHMKDLSPVVQSIISSTNSFRGQLVKCFRTLKPNTLIFLVEKMREAFALQKLLTFFQQKILAYFRY